MIRILLLFSLLATSSLTADADTPAVREFRVPAGGDIASTLRQAREWQRTHGTASARPDCPASSRDSVVIVLEGSEYTLYEPLFLRHEDSGIVIRSAGETPAVVSGGVEVRDWKPYRNGLWVADTPLFNGRPLDFRQLYVDGRKAVRARDTADFDQMHRILRNDPATETLWVPAQAVKRILRAPFAEMALHQMWSVAFLRIRSIELHGDSAAVRFHHPESRIQFEHPWPSPMVDGTHNSPFYLTNAMELLDAAGEWYHDILAHKLYYRPRTGEEMRTARVVAPALETLVHIEGTLDRPVSHIRWENIAFQYSTWMRPSQQGHVPLQAGMYLLDGYRINPKMNRGYGNHLLDNQDWLGRPAAAVRILSADHIDFERCAFEHIGSTALDYEWGTHGGQVNACLFRDIAGTALLTGSFSPVGLETHQPYLPADRREVCAHLTVRNCLITEAGTEDWGALGIGAGYVHDLRVEHNEVCEVPYTGISVGWGWIRTPHATRNNLIRHNLVHHYAKHCFDTGGIYTLGAQPGSEIAQNCIHSIYHPPYVHDPNHWFYFYADEGTAYITWRDNWMPEEKIMKNANGPGCVWSNNGPDVSDSIRQQAGIPSQIKTYLLKKTEIKQ
jgi:hypothetical protein